MSTAIRIDPRDESPRAAHERHLEDVATAATARLDAASRRARRLSWARLALAALAIAGAMSGVVPARATWPAALVVIALFALLVRAHRKAAASEDASQALVAACRAALARMRRDWPSIPALRPPSSAGGDDERGAQTSWDLGVLGDVSLFRLLDVTHPALGGRCLLDWLNADPPPLPVLEARQQSVRALRDDPAFLLDSAVIARHGARPYRAGDGTLLRRIETWGSAHVTLVPRSLRWLLRALLAAVATGAAAAVVSDRPGIEGMLGIVLVVQLAVAVQARSRLTRDVQGLDDALRAVADVVRYVRRLVAEPPVAGRLAAIQGQLADERAADAFAALERALAWNEVRYSPMADTALNIAVGFDGHLAVAIDAWRRAHGDRLPRWLALVAEAQALASLGTLAYENPDWCLPDVHESADAPLLAADALRHPLLSPERAVANRATVPSPGGVLVVSGANMAGKTTYLRAVGLNALLAGAGGPVAARAFRLRRCRVRTSVHITDDLAAATSLFLAEVTRLRAIVHDAERPDEPPVLFLLDEMLHGTNAADRRRASTRVLQRLLSAPAAGVVTTHDPEMATALGQRDGDGRRPQVTHAHFDGRVERGAGALRLTFDYVLRDGPAHGTNALAILELLGLGEPRVDDR